MFAVAGVKYEGYRITSEAEWKEFKPKTPVLYGTVPILEFDGNVLTGCRQITRFLGEKHGLAGSNDVENAKIARIIDVINDFSLKTTPWFFEKDEDRKAALKKEYMEKLFPRYMGIFEKLSTHDPEGHPWLFGSKITYADLIIPLSLLGLPC